VSATAAGSKSTNRSGQQKHEQGKASAKRKLRPVREVSES